MNVIMSIFKEFRKVKRDSIDPNTYDSTRMWEWIKANIGELVAEFREHIITLNQLHEELVKPESVRKTENAILEKIGQINKKIEALLEVKGISPRVNENEKAH